MSAESFADVTGTVPSSWYLEIKTKHDALAAALEARDRRIAELEAGLREMVTTTIGAKNSAVVLINKARDLLTGRAAGGEG